jgi:hypothetical protein
VGDLDLDGLTLVAVVVLPRVLGELPAAKTRMPFLSVRVAFSASETSKTRLRARGTSLTAE